MKIKPTCNRLGLVAVCLLLSHLSFSQFDLLEGIAANANAKRTKMLNKRYTTFFESDGQQVPMLRVPSEEVSSLAKKYILEVQSILDVCNKQWLNGLGMELDEGFRTKLTIIDAKDSDWMIDLYRKEFDFYFVYDQARDMAESKRKIEEAQVLKAKKDSINHVLRMREVVLRDSLERVRKRDFERADSLRYAQIMTMQKERDSLNYLQRTSGFHFVNTQELNLRESASFEGKILGKVGACSYVRVLGEQVNGFVKVEVSDHVGYLSARYLVDSLDKITIVSSSLTTAKSYYFVSFETVNKPKVDKDECYWNGHRLHEGPEGGCFYFSRKGNKVYVERFLCGNCD